MAIVKVGWLKTTEMYSLAIRILRSKIKCHHDWFLLEPLRESLLHATLPEMMVVAILSIPCHSMVELCWEFNPQIHIWRWGLRGVIGIP